MAQTKKDRDAALETADLSRMGRINELFTVRLQRADNVLSRAAATAWAGHDLRTGTVAALSFIAANPGAAQNDIVKRTNFDKSAINAIVNSLERLGWAERRPSESDKRRHALFVTPAGEAALQSIIDTIKQIESRMLAEMSQKAQNQLIKLLDQLHRSCLLAAEI